MMPFSRRAWPRWTPSSGFPVSPISISQDTNSLRTNEKNVHDGFGRRRNKDEIPSRTHHHGACVSATFLFLSVLGRQFGKYKHWAEQQFIQINVTVATNTILEWRNALFEFEGPFGLFKQLSLCFIHFSFVYIRHKMQYYQIHSSSSGCLCQNVYVVFHSPIMYNWETTNTCTFWWPKWAKWQIAQNCKPEQKQ